MSNGNGQSVCVTLSVCVCADGSLVEGNTVQLEDGTTAFIQHVSVQQKGIISKIIKINNTIIYCLFMFVRSALMNLNRFDFKTVLVNNLNEIVTRCFVYAIKYYY